MRTDRLTTRPSDFREAFLAVYQARRKSLRARYTIAFEECARPAEEVGLSFLTANGHYALVFISICGEVRGWVTRAKKPRLGLKLLKYSARATDPAVLMGILEHTLDEVASISEATFNHEAKVRIRKLWADHIEDAQLEF